MDSRSTTLADRLGAIRERIVRACQRAGRSPEDITLVGVTKTFPIQAVEEALEAGLHHFGENKVQELVEKAAALRAQVQGGNVTWHMIGHLQRNKAKEIVRHAGLFHGLDSLRLADELEKRAAEEDRVLPCLLQVNVSGEASKFGVPPDEALGLIDQMSGHEHLALCGLMAIAEPVNVPEEVRPQFQQMRSLFESYDKSGHRSDWKWLSMGMSSDFEVAIEEGATHIRVGSAIFGDRSYEV